VYFLITEFTKGFEASFASALFFIGYKIFCFGSRHLARRVEYIPFFSFWILFLFRSKQALSKGPTIKFQQMFPQ